MTSSSATTQATTWHRCYGLVLRSELPLPELPHATPAEPDLTVRTTPLTGRPADAVHLPRGLWRSGDRWGVTIDGVAAFEARGGRELLVDPAPGADPAQLRLYLLGTMLGAAMMQRGHLVLHGNAVRIGDACAVVVGHSGAGKSTLAAEFAARGLPVLSDDVVPIDASGHALPGRPRIHLWSDALARLGVDPGRLERVHHHHDKFVLPLDDAVEPVPVRWIYVLERHAGQELALLPVRGAGTYPLLHEHTYRREFVTGAEASREHLRQCAALTRTARLSRVLRPATTMTAAATADAILDDIDDDTTPDRPTQECA